MKVLNRRKGGGKEEGRRRKGGGKKEGRRREGVRYLTPRRYITVNCILLPSSCSNNAFLSWSI